MFNKRKAVTKPQAKSQDQEEENGDLVSKKRFQSKSQTITTKSKGSTINIKEKTSKQQQIDIMKGIEGTSIQKNVVETFKKFDPPQCKTCKNRNADRVCINKQCGITNFMSLICGKCHSEVHQKFPQKSEIDIEEFFIKLATFINDQQYEKKKQHQIQTINVETLEQSFDEINKIKSKLLDIKSYLELDIKDSEKNIYDIAGNSSIQALSDCDYDNMKAQLVNIKECITFKSNKFYWNDASQKYLNYSLSINDIRNSIEQLDKKINSSYQQQSVLEFTITTYQNAAKNLVSIQENQEITLLPSNQPGYSQVVSKNILQKELKYILRVQIETDNQYYPMIGLIRQSFKDTLHIYEENLCYYTCYGATKIIKGGQLFYAQVREIEMYISISDNKLLVSDYPNHGSVNSLSDGNTNLSLFTDLSIGFSKGTTNSLVKYKIIEFQIVDSEPDW